MADNVKILKGSIDDMPASITEGQIYFATSSDKEDGKLYKGKIFVDIDPDTRISFGEHADTAISDASGNEIISTYLHHLSITDIDFEGNPSEENLYLRGFTPINVQVPGLDQSDWPNYTLPAANANTPGLLSLTAQNIYGDKTFVDNIYFANGADYFIDDTGSGKLKGLIADNNTTFSNSVSVAPDSLIDSDGFNICLQNSGNNNTTGLLLTSSSLSSNGFIQYEYTSTKGQLTLGINSAHEGDEIIIQSPGENSIQHYNDLTQTYSTILDTGNFKNLQISIFGSTTDYNFKNNSNSPDFIFDGFTSSPLIYAGNAYQDMVNTVADSTVSTGINADKLNGYTYLNIATEMILSNDEISEIIG